MDLSGGPPDWTDPDPESRPGRERTRRMGADHHRTLNGILQETMRIVSRAGPYIAAMPLAAPEDPTCKYCQNPGPYGEIEPHSCTTWGNTAGMNPERGPWFSVRLEVGLYDPVLKQDYRIPIAKADCWKFPDRLEVVRAPSPQEGRTAQYYLDRLEPDERQRLFSDLKEV